MNEQTKAQVEAYAEECRTEQLELLRTLGKMPAPTRKEDFRAAFCRDWLRAQGAENVRIDSAKNVICKLGPGIGDDTANLVNLLMAAKYLIQKQTALEYGVLVVANACEEGLGNLDGTKALFAKYGTRIQGFYSFDIYMPLCCSSAVGSYRYKITCKTPGGHSYANFGDPSAIQLLCGLVNELYQIQPPVRSRTTYNVGRIEGGTTVNSIAQQASMLYEFRSTAQDCLEEMEEKFRRAVAHWNGRGGDFEVELLGIRPGNGPVDQKKLGQFTAKSKEIVRTFTGREPDETPNSTDSNIPLSLGIPANTIGTIDGGSAHTRQEWVDIASLPTGLKIVLGLMLEYQKNDCF